jgi:hypothetical protein
MRRLTRKRALVIVGVLALMVAAAGSALAASRSTVPKVSKGILTYDANASASPTTTVLGTTFGTTWYADCNMPNAGDAQTRLYVQTSDGSLSWDLAGTQTSGGTNTSFTGREVFPAGTFTIPQFAGQVTAAAGNNSSGLQDDLIQLGPSVGHILLHANADTTAAPTATCHVAIEVFSDKIKRAAGLGAVPPPHVDPSRPLLTR